MILPAFSYNVQTGSLVDETSTLVCLLCIPVCRMLTKTLITEKSNYSNEGTTLISLHLFELKPLLSFAMPCFQQVVGVLWGMCLAALVHPLAVGVFITCAMLMVAVMLCAVFASLTLQHFSKTSYFLTGLPPLSLQITLNGQSHHLLTLRPGTSTTLRLLEASLPLIRSQMIIYTVFRRRNGG